MEKDVPESLHPSTIRPTSHRTPLALLLADTDGPATTTGGLGVLAAHAETPVVSEAAVGADLLEPLEILAELGLHLVGEDLAVLAVGDVALSVEEPGRDLVLRWVLDDGDDALEFFGRDLTGAVTRMQVSAFRSFPHTFLFSHRRSRSKAEYAPLVQVDIGLFADQVGVAAANTLDLGEGVHDLLLAVNIGVEQTQDELEVRLLAGHER